jgi:ATP-dependent Clp protease protease subunit
MRKTLKIDPRLTIHKLEEVLHEPVIIRVNKFDEESLEKFEADLDDAVDTGQPVVPIVIDSYGGQLHTVFGMIAAIESIEVPVATILTTKAMSCGAVLFSFGTEGYRFMHPDATMMIHDASWGTGGKVEEVKNDAKYLDEKNKLMYRKMAKHLGQDKDYVLDLIKEHSHVDWFLTAREAKKYGFANHLRIPKFEVEISLDIRFG